MHFVVELYRKHRQQAWHSVTYCGSYVTRFVTNEGFMKSFCPVRFEMSILFNFILDVINIDSNI